MGIQKVQNELGRRLKQLRMDSHLTQEDVANEVSMSRDHLSNIENGKYPINIKTSFATSSWVRMDSHLTQEDVANEVSMSRDHLSNIENGKYPINIKTLYKLAEFFKVDMKYFF